jgi:hypothetical protein
MATCAPVERLQNIAQQELLSQPVTHNLNTEVARKSGFRPVTLLPTESRKALAITLSSHILLQLAEPSAYVDSCHTTVLWSKAPGGALAERNQQIHAILKTKTVFKSLPHTFPDMPPICI